MIDELEKRFAYHPPKNSGIVEDHQIVRRMLFDVADALREICPESRERALAFTKLEEAMFWANAAIARIKNYEE